MIIRTMVAAAALAVLAGVASVQVGAQASTAPPAAAGPTFARDVATIFYKNCTNCHRPGEIAPMSLLTFTDARPWARSIATRVAKGTMPPWHADPSHGEFLNDRRLTELEKNTIVQWVNAGAPEGNPADLPAEPAGALRAADAASRSAVRVPGRHHANSGGPDRRPPVAARAAEASGSQRSPGAADGAVDWRVRAGSARAHLSGRQRHEAAGRRHAHPPDALHGER